MPGQNLLGYWNAEWGDGDKNAYRIRLKNGAVHMSVFMCINTVSMETCASQKEAVVTPSKSEKYAGWMQALNVHGGEVTIYMKKIDSGLSLVWQRPSGYRTTGIGKLMPGKKLCLKFIFQFRVLYSFNHYCPFVISKNLHQKRNFSANVCYKLSTSSVGK